MHPAQVSEEVPRGVTTFPLTSHRQHVVSPLVGVRPGTHMYPAQVSEEVPRGVTTFPLTSHRQHVVPCGGQAGYTHASGPGFRRSSKGGHYISPDKPPTTCSVPPCGGQAGYTHVSGPGFRRSSKGGHYISPDKPPTTCSPLWGSGRVHTCIRPRFPKKFQGGSLHFP